MTFIAEFEQALTNVYKAEARVKELTDALENERICRERLGAIVAAHLKELANAGRCCE